MGRNKNSRPKPEKLNSGVDWITATSDSDDAGLAWYLVYKRYVDQTGGPSLIETKGWQDRWYSGVIHKGVAWGRSDKYGYIIKAQGPPSDIILDKVTPRAKRVTRVDLQTTVWLNKPVVGMAMAEYLKVLELDKSRNVTVLSNSKGGNTLYIGSRSSQQFGRLYDWGHRHGVAQPGEIWRYEIEYKKPLSDKIARLVTEYKTLDERTQIITSTVYTWFAKRGVRPVFFNASGAGLVASVGKQITATDRKLEWIRTQVAPNLQKLLSDVGAVRVREALGLDQSQLIDLLSADLPSLAEQTTIIDR